MAQRNQRKAERRPQQMGPAGTLQVGAAEVKEQGQEHHAQRPGKVALQEQGAQVVGHKKPQDSHGRPQPGPAGLKPDIQPGQRAQKADHAHKNQVAVQRFAAGQRLAQGHEIGRQRRPVAQQLYPVIPHWVVRRPPAAFQNGPIHKASPVDVVHGVRPAGICAVSAHPQHHENGNRQIAHRSQQKKNASPFHLFQVEEPPPSPRMVFSTASMASSRASFLGAVPPEEGAFSSSGMCRM